MPARRVIYSTGQGYNGARARADMQTSAWPSLEQPLLEADATKYIVGQRSAVVLLVFTVVLETAGTLSLKRSGDGMQYYAAAYVCYGVSLGLFSVVLRHIPLSVAYSTWCTMGTVLVSVLSSWLYGDTISVYKWVCIGCTVPCVVGMYALP